MTPIAGRYVPTALLGEGGAGQVWRCTDRWEGKERAIKLIPHRPGAESVRDRREVEALRRLNLPGVVELLDEGVDQGYRYIVMPLLPGGPFPGASEAPDALRDLARRLLEVIGQVHAALHVHRDLKPTNIQVSPSGEVTLLDFGLARPLEGAASWTRSGEVMGTWRYLSPECLAGAQPHPSRDLYAIGVTLYEALTGRSPWPSADALGPLIQAKQAAEVPPLPARYPADLRALIAALLRRDPQQRPGTAGQALAILDDASPPSAPPPWLGGEARLLPMLERLREGGPLRLSGPPGSGRSRTLHALGQRLGRPILELRPGKGALSGLIELLGPPSGASLAEVEAQLAATLRLRLQDATLLMDDDDAHDPRTLALVLRCAPWGPVLRAGAPGSADDLPLPPLPVEALEPLFIGPRRVLDAPGRAARALHLRTEGWPGAVWRELEAWRRAGLARPEGQRWRLDPSALDALDAGHGRPLAPPVAAPPTLDADEETLLGWLGLNPAGVRFETVCDAAEQPRWVLEHTLLGLMDRGLVRRGPDARLRPALHVTPPSAWRLPRWDACAARLAQRSPPGEPGRLDLLLRVGGPQEIASELGALTQALSLEGRLGHAMAELERGISALREEQPSEALTALFERYTELALRREAPGPLAQALGRLTAWGAPTALGELLSCFSDALRGPAAPALARATDAPHLQDLRLETWRHAARVLAARRLGLSEEGALLRALEAWVEAQASSHVQARYFGWLAHLAYREGDPERALRLAALVAPRRPEADAKVAALLSEAAYALDAGALERCQTAAEEALALAMERGLSRYAARAEWSLRRAALARRLSIDTDLLLIEIVEDLELPLLAAQLRLTEAGLAWHRGDPERGQALATQAWRWAQARFAPLASLSLSLAMRCGHVASKDELRWLLHALPEQNDSIALQCAALAWDQAPPELRAHALGRLEGWQSSPQSLPRSRPRELLSPAEVLERMAPSL